LEGGCTAPIGAFAEIIGDEILFKGCLFSLDGQTKLEVENKVLTSKYKGFGMDCAKFILNNGGYELMHSIKKQLK
jgi:hydroxymethylbilane synthase